ncbi:hypothetical protein LguiA_029093 [Lonicera macranthoides]
MTVSKRANHVKIELKAFSLKGDSNSLGLCFARFFPFSRLWNKHAQELFALREQIENDNIGLSEDLISKCLTESIYCSSDRFQDEGTCVICLEEYKNMDDVGMLRGCHTSTTSSPLASVNGKWDVTIGDLGLAAIFRKSHAAYWVDVGLRQFDPTWSKLIASRGNNSRLGKLDGGARRGKL